MKHHNTLELYEYWNKLRAGRIAPYRSEISPRAISNLLESTFILEHVGDKNVRFRLAGTKLCENFGMELRGMNALALWHGECRTQAQDMIQKVVSEPCIGHISCTVETQAGYLFDAEFLYMPLRSDFGDISRVLGCGYYMGASESNQVMPNLNELGSPGNEPFHHWIDHVETKPIKIDVIDKPYISTRSTSTASFSPFHTSAMNTHQKPVFTGPPKLQTIQGGGNSASTSNTINGPVKNLTPRRQGHLRLIKDEAG